jgi:hypothetical protein
MATKLKHQSIVRGTVRGKVMRNITRDREGNVLPTPIPSFRYTFVPDEELELPAGVQPQFSNPDPNLSGRGVTLMFVEQGKPGILNDANGKPIPVVRSGFSLMEEYSAADLTTMKQTKLALEDLKDAF